MARTRFNRAVENNNQKKRGRKRASRVEQLSTDELVEEIAGVETNG